VTDKPYGLVINPDWSTDSTGPINSYYQLKMRQRALRKAERMRIIRDSTEPWHLFDLSQLHVPPRRVHREPTSYELMITPRRSVADALFPRARQILLLVFFQEPTIWYRQTDLLRLSHAGMGGLQREIHNLLSVQLIEAKPLESQPNSYLRYMQYRANPKSPMFGVLCDLAQQFQQTVYRQPQELPPDTYYIARGEVDLLMLSRVGMCSPPDGID